MRVELERMDDDAIGRFLERSWRSYVAEQIASGVAAAEAERIATAQQSEAFPARRPVGGHVVFDIVVDGGIAGHLWIGPRVPGNGREWWIWDVEVDPAWRGRGVGRTVLRLAEDEARACGATEIGLQVFADNSAARHLYQALGYHEAAVRLRKDL
jgi:ribosomal protein S18 acetylase RimI-like enzyme